MDLIHPHTKADVVEAIRLANEEATRLLVVGGRHHIDKGNPAEVDAELWTTQLDRVVAYEPAEMIAVVEAGIRVGALATMLAEGGQEWPVDAPEEATVGGVIASAAVSPRRLRVGAVRDTVVEAEIVTGDGRPIRSGARTVKNVTGYDLHKLVAGSLGTLGVIVQVALKLRPLPRARRTVRFDGGIELANALLGVAPSATAALVHPGGVELRLEGWPEEVEDLEIAASGVARPVETVEDEPFPRERPWEASEIVAEVAVPPSRLGAVVEHAGSGWGALAGVGIAWIGVDTDSQLASIRAYVGKLGGIAPVIRGSGGLGVDAIPAPEVQRRIKRAFDPNEVLAPGRGWAGT